MSSELHDQMDVKITTSAMQRNWKMLKQINVNDILDTMIEKSLITIDASKNILRKETESQQAEALLYLVFSKSQTYLDDFMFILANNGYEFIVQRLLEDQASEASNIMNISVEDRRPKTSGQQFRRSDSGPLYIQRQLSEAVQNEKEDTSRKRLMEEMKAEMQKQQTETIEILTRHQSEETMRQTQELRKHNEDIIKEEFTKLKQNEDQQKANEAKIERLEAQLKVLQNKLEQERAKIKKDRKNTNEKVQDIQNQRDELKLVLTLAKRESNEALRRVKEENLFLRNQIQQGKNNRTNRFTTPLYPKLAQTREDVRNRRR